MSRSYNCASRCGDTKGKFFKKYANRRAAALQLTQLTQFSYLRVAQLVEYSTYN